jgi:hypothetical protein
MGYDGGARQSVPLRRSPEAEHNETLVESMRSGASDVGIRL